MGDLEDNRLYGYSTNLREGRPSDVAPNGIINFIH